MTKIRNVDVLKKLAHEANSMLEEDSAFERLLKVLTDHGMNEDKAAQMIADCITEQYQLDAIADTFNDVYQDAKETVTNLGVEYKA